jgi:Arc/MetJ-type ribon-helix-helix transcriptional regulator
VRSLDFKNTVKVYPRLVVVSVRLPEDTLAALKDLVSAGKYRSRSHAIRTAIRLLLEKEYNS